MSGTSTLGSMLERFAKGIARRSGLAAVGARFPRPRFSRPRSPHPRAGIGRLSQMALCSPRGEKGQVLILVAVAGVGLLGFLALALDVGSLYAERRRAQAAADAAALVGAQNAQGVMPNVTLIANDAVRDARQWAIKNGYITDPGANNHTWNAEVRVDVPPETGPFRGPAANFDYIEVRIRRNLNSLFAGVLGVNLEVSARAVARAKHTGFEVATISLDPGDASTVVNGSATIGVVGSTYSRGVTKNLAGDFNISRRAYARGGINGSVNAGEGVVTNPPDLFDPGWDAPFAEPEPGLSWNSNIGQTPDGEGYIWIDPGTYHWISVAAGDKVKFRPGVYRTTRSQGVKINGEAYSTGPVCFVIDGGGAFESQATAGVNLYSGPEYNNILIWTQSSGNAVKIAGGNNVTFQGTIYALNATATLAGSATGTVHGQVVARNIVFAGSAGVAVVYDPNNTPDVPGPALVE